VNKCEYCGQEQPQGWQESICAFCGAYLPIKDIMPGNVVYGHEAEVTTYRYRLELLKRLSETYKELIGEYYDYGSTT